MGKHHNLPAPEVKKLNLPKVGDTLDGYVVNEITDNFVFLRKNKLDFIV
jgi:hypothetical protein